MTKTLIDLQDIRKTYGTGDAQVQALAFQRYWPPSLQECSKLRHQARLEMKKDTSGLQEASEFEV